MIQNYRPIVQQQSPFNRSGQAPTSQGWNPYQGLLDQMQPGANAAGYPLYQSLLENGTKLVGNAYLRPQQLAGPQSDAMLKQYDAQSNLNARNLQDSLARSTARNVASVAQFGAPVSYLSQIQSRGDNAGWQALGNFYGQNAANRFGVQDQLAQRQLGVDQFNALQQSQADRLNLQTLLGERDKSYQSAQDLFSLLKQLEAGQAEASALQSAANAARRSGRNSAWGSLLGAVGGGLLASAPGGGGGPLGAAAGGLVGGSMGGLF